MNRLQPIAAPTVAPTEQAPPNYSGIARAAQLAAGAVTEGRQRSAFEAASEQEAAEGTTFLAGLRSQNLDQVSRDVASGLVSEEDRAVFQSGSLEEQVAVNARNLQRARDAGTAAPSYIQRHQYLLFAQQAASNPGGAIDFAKSMGIVGSGPNSFDTSAERNRKVREEGADDVRELLGDAGYNVANMSDDQAIAATQSSQYNRAVEHKRRKRILEDSQLSVEERLPTAQRTMITDAASLGSDIQSLAEDLKNDSSLSPEEKVLMFQQEGQQLLSEKLLAYADYPDLQSTIEDRVKSNVQMGHDYLSGQLSQDLWKSGGDNLTLMKAQAEMEVNNLEQENMRNMLALTAGLVDLSGVQSNAVLQGYDFDLDSVRSNLADRVGRLNSLQGAYARPGTPESVRTAAVFAAPPPEDEPEARIDVITTAVQTLGLDPSTAGRVTPSQLDKMITTVEGSGTDDEVALMHRRVADAVLNDPKLQQKLASDPANATTLKSVYRVVQSKVGKQLTELESALNNSSMWSAGNTQDGVAGFTFDLAQVAEMDPRFLERGVVRFGLKADAGKYLNEFGIDKANQALRDINARGSQELTSNITSVANMQNADFATVVSNLLGGNPALVDTRPGGESDFNAVELDGGEAIDFTRGSRILEMARAAGVPEEEAKKVIEDNPWITAVQSSPAVRGRRAGEASDSAPLAETPEVATQAPTGGEVVQGDVPSADDGSEFGVQLGAARGPEVFSPEPYVPEGGSEGVDEKASYKSTQELSDAFSFSPEMQATIVREGTMEKQATLDATGNPQGVKMFDGELFHPYKDPLGKWTIGFGHLIGDGSGTFEQIPSRFKEGIDPATAATQLQNDHDDAAAGVQLAAARRDVDYDTLPEEAKKVFLDMTFNLGSEGLYGFPKMWRAVKAGDWKEVAKEMKHSKWYRQTKSRAVAHVKTIRELAE